MSRKIALLLIMFILGNMVVSASGDPNGASDDPNTEGMIWVVIGITAIIVSVILVVVTVAEADVPDDGIRLVSMQNVPLEPKGSFGSFLNVLQHVSLGYIPENDKTFFGLKFKF